MKAQSHKTDRIFDCAWQSGLASGAMTVSAAFLVLTVGLLTGVLPAAAAEPARLTQVFSSACRTDQNICTVPAQPVGTVCFCGKSRGEIVQQ